MPKWCEKNKISVQAVLLLTNLNYFGLLLTGYGDLGWALTSLAYNSRVIHGKMFNDKA